MSHEIRTRQIEVAAPSNLLQAPASARRTSDAKDFVHFGPPLRPRRWGRCGDRATRRALGAHCSPGRRSLCVGRRRFRPAHVPHLSGDVRPIPWAKMRGSRQPRHLGPGGENSWDRLAETAKDFAANGFHALEEAPLLLGPLAIVGTIGWYDGSFRDEIGVDAGDYERKYCPSLNTGWADAEHVRWDYTDARFTEFTARKLETHLAMIPQTATAICCTHHLPTRRLLHRPRWLVPKHWRFTNAFLGSDCYGTLLLGDSRARLAMSGHIHARRSYRSGAMVFATVGGNYRDKEVVTWDGGKLRRLTFQPPKHRA